MTIRHVYDVPLRPILGSTFQPTGFPDLGPATFDRIASDGQTTSALLVESVQSMANRLEATAWDSPTAAPATAVSGLPYVEVQRAKTGEFLTSSRLEAHRLFSAFIRDSQWDGHSVDHLLVERLGVRPDTPVDHRAMARAIMALDPFSLLHGVFFAGQTTGRKGRANWPTQPRFARAISGVIEAHDVRRAVSGGRKSDLVHHRDEKEGDNIGGSAEGYGSVPFHRTEWTAGTITASFVVDVDLIRSYGLPAPAAELLETLALWEVRAFLSGGLRLRTACDLDVAGDIHCRKGQPLPEQSELDARLRAAIDASADVLGHGKAISVQWEATVK